MHNRQAIEIDSNISWHSTHLGFMLFEGAKMETTKLHANEFNSIIIYNNLQCKILHSITMMATHWRLVQHGTRYHQSSEIYFEAEHQRAI